MGFQIPARLCLVRTKWALMRTLGGVLECYVGMETRTGNGREITRWTLEVYAQVELKIFCFYYTFKFVYDRRTPELRKVWNERKTFSIEEP